MSDVARPRRGEELELDVHGLAYGGDGVARLGAEGYVVFVAGAVPGDRVRAHVYKSKRAYAHARTVELLRPSAERIAPRADHPGVPWQVLPYKRQIEVKREQIEDALRRIGRLDGFVLEDMVPAAQEWRYRNKLEYSFGHGPHGELVCGFHAPARWNQVIQMEDCLLASEASNEARRAAQEWCVGQGLRAWERAARPQARPTVAQMAGAVPVAAGERSGRGRAERRMMAAQLAVERTDPGPDGRALLRNLVVREGRRTGKLQVRLVSTDGALDTESLVAALRDRLSAERLSGVMWTRSRQLGETTAGGDTELLWGEAELPERICGLDFLIGPESFFQTNTEMAEVLYGVVAQYAALSGSELVYDLYCGLGTIGLSLAGGAGEVWGVEISPQAVEGAGAAAVANGITNARFVAGEARRAVRELLAGTGQPDVVVADPPRSGLGRKAVEAVIATAAHRIVYVSCNPTTLAADAALLVEAGWRLSRVRPVDMFPQTHHIECVAEFTRR
ncbi:MAG: 23S rRNA (uracil(1939)-C(5))-methyltransferase RlmD [Solirubrobacteraceae bacterium]